MPKLPEKQLIALKIPQVRCLRELAGGGLLSRQRLSERLGLSPVSGTVTRVLNGLREGSSSGAAHPGLIAMGLVAAETLDLDGAEETAYKITPAGRAAMEKWLETNELPPLRSAESSTNRRYQIDA